jgi:hypothetical protein
MVASIVSIVVKHCLQSTSAKNLLDKLKLCKSFLSALKEIDSFMVSENIEAPGRYIMASYLK